MLLLQINMKTLLFRAFDVLQLQLALFYVLQCEETQHFSLLHVAECCIEPNNSPAAIFWRVSLIPPFRKEFSFEFRPKSNISNISNDK